MKSSTSSCRFWFLSNWRTGLMVVLLALSAGLVVAACSDGGSSSVNDDTEEMLDVPDTTDAVDTPDTPDPDVQDTNDVDDTNDADDSDQDTADGDTTTVPDPQPTPGEVLEDVEGALGSDVVDAIATDLNGDGYLDLVGITDTEIAISLFDSSGGLIAPFTWQAQITIAHGTTPTHIRAGNFNGDTLQDLVLYDGDNGGVRILAQDGAAASLGVAFDNPLIAFDNPLIAFDNPLIAFDNPLIAFDNPLIAIDLDGNGLDDLAFAGGENGLSVGWIDATGNVASPFALDLQQPMGLSDFAPVSDAVPVTLESVDFDGQGADDLLVGFLLQNDTEHDALAPFVAGQNRGFDNPLIATNSGYVFTDKGLQDIEVSDLNADGQADAAWVSNISESSSSAGIWLSNGFDNPLIATTAGESFTFGGAFGGLEAGLLLIDQNVGFGGGGTDGLALLNALSHLIINPVDPAGEAVAIGVGSNGQLGAPLALTGSTGLGGIAFDVNGDGFTEFLSPGSAGFSVLRQKALDDLDLQNDMITLADGTTVPACEVVATWCDEGTQGVCQYGRKTCGGCTAGADFQSEFGVAFADVFEPTGETLCDGIDNDCDGLVDNLAPETVRLASQFDGVRTYISTWEAGYALTYLPNGGPITWALRGDLAAPLDDPFSGQLVTASNTTDGTSPVRIDSSGLLTLVQTVDATGRGVTSWFDGMFDSNRVFTQDLYYLPPLGGFEIFAVETSGFPDFVRVETGGGDLSGSWTSPHPVQELMGAYNFVSDTFGVVRVDNNGSEDMVAFGVTLDFMIGNIIHEDAYLFTDDGSLAALRVKGGPDALCLARAWDSSRATRLDVQLVPIVPTMQPNELTFDLATATVVHLSSGPVVPESVHASYELGICRVTWLEAVGGSPSHLLRTATIAADGEVVYRANLDRLTPPQTLDGQVSTAHNLGDRFFSVSDRITGAADVWRYCE